MIHRILANRALGILSHFFDLRSDITTWLIPSNICFSVPFLLISKNIHFEMFDFGFELESIFHAAGGNSKKTTGVILLNHYGMLWEQDTIKQVNDSFGALIIDACLSAPEISPPSNLTGDLLLFSTGKGKIVELGFGAIAYTQNPIVLQKDSNDCEPLQKRYEWLDDYWKERLKSGANLDPKICLEIPWVDLGTHKIGNPKTYLSQVSSTLEKELPHRKLINDVYDTLISKDLIWNSKSNLWRYHLWIDNPEEAISGLFEKNLFASRHYANAAMRFKKSGKFQKSILIENHIVNLFNSRQIDLDFAEKCAKTVESLRKLGKIKPGPPLI